jgi:hypothetical protein
MPSYQGGCHCGRVRFEVTAQIDEAIECKKGFLHLLVEPKQFRLLTPQDAVAVYQFNTRTAKHYFCSTCGVCSYYLPRSHPDKIDVNVRCLEGITLEELTIVPFNGREWEKSRHTLAD